MAETILNAQHHWSEIISDFQYVCSVCRTKGGGFFGPMVTQCLICGIIKHQDCLLERAVVCKPFIQSGSSDQFCHMWKAPTDKSTRCDHCSRSCRHSDFSVLQCLWCQKTVHQDCSIKIDEICDFGPLKDAIIFPTEIELRQKSLTEQESSLFDFEMNFEFTSPTKCPIIAIVNKRSGSSQGEAVLAEFYKHLNPIQVIDLVEEGFDRLQLFKKLIPNMRIIVGGGDGTVGTTLDYIKRELQEDKTLTGFDIPVAIFPLGTGNDFSRVLGWGDGTAKAKVQDQITNVLYSSEEVVVDRWHVNIERFDGGRSIPVLNKTVNNYIGIGVDAKITQSFYDFRDKYPNLCKNLFFNKVMYAVLGILIYLKHESPNIHKKINVYCNDQQVPLRQARGIVLQNVLTWSGGVKELFAETRRMKRAIKCGALVNGNAIDTDKYQYADNFARQSVSDGLIEGIVLTSALHIGMLHVGVAPGVPLCQGSKIVVDYFETDSILPVHTDGEPVQCQGPFRITVDQCQKTLMLGYKGRIRTQKEYSFLPRPVEGQFTRLEEIRRKRIEL